MSDPLYDSRTPRLSLPLLFAGQAQKETYVNEALARLDGLLHAAIEGVANAPPASAADGQAWLVNSAPTGAWAGHAGDLAVYEATAWLFQTPRDGIRVLNRATGQELRYAGGWQTPARPAAPSGGSTVDTEARTAIAAILTALTVAGLIAAG